MVAAGVSVAQRVAAAGWTSWELVTESAGAVLFAVLTVWGLWSVHTSESSTAVLGLHFAPFVQVAVAGLTMALAVGVARLRRRRAAGVVQARPADRGQP
ncbi:hypothetical protein GTQ99_02680 [Kineococcus sp. T13]|uniref:hypothetical protein n=1 Tax=Kineococcus vitellinus TaxID=2696565 RepID=UPI0014137738|nr:hypothetical protein [Kineococcus vitellinus]NAZ74331.1 hypothetical protein [Kineococcus vitellinus]